MKNITFEVNNEVSDKVNYKVGPEIKVNDRAQNGVDDKINIRA